MLLFSYHFHKGEQLFIDFLFSSPVDQNPSKVVSKEDFAPLIRIGPTDKVAKFKNVRVAFPKMHLFTSVGIPKHHWLLIM